MIARLQRATLFALYQMSLLLGIVLLPMAMAFERMGLHIPYDQLLRTVGDAYEDATPN